LQLGRKKANNPSQQKPTNKAAVRFKFKGLITTNKGVPKQTKTYHITGTFWWKTRNKQHPNTPTD